MSREHARVATRRLGDQDWAALSPLAAWLYDQLLITPGISPTGVVPLQPRQWAKRNTGTNVIALTEEIIEAVLWELADARYVLVDRDTEEVMVRTFIRGDGIATNHKMLLSLCGQVDMVRSGRLRENLAAEIERARAALTVGKNTVLYEKVMTSTDMAVKELRGDPYNPPPRGGQIPLPMGHAMGPAMGDRIPHDNPHPEPLPDPPSDPPSDGGVRKCGVGVGEGVGVPVLEVESSKEKESACAPLSDHGSTRAHGGAHAHAHTHTREGDDPPRTALTHDQEPTDPDVARASTLTHGYLALEPMALYERVKPVVLLAVRTGKYRHDEIADALARLAADDRSVTVETLRIELSGGPRARPKATSSSAAYLALIKDDDPEPWSTP